MASPRSNRPHTARPLLLFCWSLAVLAGCSDGDSGPTQPVPGSEDLARGKQTFRFDTFGDETFWTDTLRMHEVIQAGVSPQTALAVGLKVDADALPPGTLESADLTIQRPRSRCSSSMRWWDSRGQCRRSTARTR